MTKGSMALSAAAVIATGGYLAYEQLGPKDAAEAGASAAATNDAEEADAGTPVRKVRELAMPSLIGMMPDEARVELRRRGFADGALELPRDIACTYDDDNEMVAVGAICNQERSAGVAIMSNARVRVAVEKDTYEHGGVEIGDEWRRMPDVTGLPLAEALEVLRDRGFGDDELEIVERGSCDKGTVCVQRPRAGTRKHVRSTGELNIGT